VLVVVDDEGVSLRALAGELESRYGAHYQVVHPHRARHRSGLAPAAGAFLLETTTPGVFAVGDVRHGSMKRVAAAVGEGSTVIRLIHDYLALAPSDQSPDPLPGRPAR
jgi:NADPH-dependent glutamate synthase beta subunit-like oxidoreductase